MPNQPSIDIETFKWVKGEVDVTLLRAEEQVQQYVRSDDKVDLYNLVNHLHQVVGSLQMLELKSLSTLLLESEVLVEDFIEKSSVIRKASFVVLVDSALNLLRANLERIEHGQGERSIEIVELVNQIRAVRGQDDIEISSLFSPAIDFYPQVNSAEALRDKVYTKRATVLRSHYQMALLDFLKDKPQQGSEKMRAVFDKVFEMSTFGSVARLWWVATAYADFLNLNAIGNRAVHTRILRQIDDLLRSLSQVGESALVSDPADELIKIMLFYTVSGEQRSERMSEIINAFQLQDYFIETTSAASQDELNGLVKGLIDMSPSAKGLVSKTRSLVTDYFESETPSDEHLLALISELESLSQHAEKHNVPLIVDLCKASLLLIIGIRSGEVIADDETGFHLASAIIFIDTCVSFPNEYDQDSHETGQSKLLALRSLLDSSSTKETPKTGSLTRRDRKELLDVIGSEIERNLHDVEARLEAFALDMEDSEQLVGIGDKVTQVRGALQVLGEQKVGLLLTIAEQQFRAIERQDKKATPELVEALAISIGTMEEYVRGLKSGRVDMDYILDRSITDLEVAIGKRVMRADVETLLESASGSLIAWLGDQSDFQLFNKLKSSHRDLTVLSRKTKLVKVEQLVREQDRLIDVISQEPAFLTDNIVANLQNNMAEITGLVIELYGTEESSEESMQVNDFVLRPSFKEQGTSSVQIHDDMDLSEAGVDVDLLMDDIEQRSMTFIAKEHAAKERNIPRVSDAIFDVFVTECGELIEESKVYQRECEDDLDDRNAIRNLRRVFHTLKGSARMVGLDGVGELAWSAESMFNYVLDTGKPMTFSAMAFSQKTLNEIGRHREQGFRTEEKIDAAPWANEARELCRGIDESEDALRQKNAVPTMDLSGLLSPKSPADMPADDSAVEEPTIPSDVPSEINELDHQDDEVIELGLEYSEDLDLGDVVESPSNQFFEQPPVVELDLSDDELTDIDLNDMDLTSVALKGEEQTGVEQTDIELTDVELTDVELTDVELTDVELTDVELTDVELTDVELTDEDSIGLDDDHEPLSHLSFQVIEDESMRDVFVGEANDSLRVITEEIVDLGTPYIEDDALSICLHTLLGNARTLGLDPVAAAYANAQSFCESRQLQQARMSASDQLRFESLVGLTQEFLDSASNQDPYFKVDEQQWQAQADAFQQAANEISETASDLGAAQAIANSSGVDLAAINLELELIGDEDDEDDLLELSELIDPDIDEDDIEYVNASSLLEIDADEGSIASNFSDGLADDLDEIEASIKHYRDASRLDEITGLELDSEDIDDDDDDDEPVLKPEGSYRKTMIPLGIEDLLASDDSIDVDDEFASEETEGSDVELTDDLVVQLEDESSLELIDESVIELANESLSALAEEAVIELTDESLEELTEESLIELTEEPALELTDESLAELTEEPVLELTDESLSELTEEPVLELTDESLAELTEEPVLELTDESLAELTEEPVLELTDESLAELTEEPVLELTDESLAELTEEPVLELTDESLAELTEEPVLELTDESLAELTEEPALELTDESLAELTEEPALELTDESLSELTEEPLLELTEESIVESIEEPASEASDESVNNAADESASVLLDDELLAEPEEQVLSPVEQSNDADVEEVDPVIREIFVNEMREIHNTLDQDVAKLNDIQQSPQLMANVMRHLHTIKGSALMAEAKALGSLTHSLESFLGSTFIRDLDDLKHVQNTLELFIDDLDLATSNYQKGQTFAPAQSLLERLSLDEPGVADVVATDEVVLADKVEEVEEVEVVPEVVPDESAQEASEESTYLESLEAVEAQLKLIYSNWKSSRAWWKVRPQLVKQAAEMGSLAARYAPQYDASPLVDEVSTILKTMQFHVSEQFDSRSDSIKAMMASLLEYVQIGPEAQKNSGAVSLKQQISDLQAIMASDALISSDKNSANNASKLVDAAKPAEQVSATADARPEVIDAALRIRSDTLDSLTNFVGDASMNRSQMREDVTTLKGVVSKLFQNVELFGTQLRELEIEADSRISARAKEQEIVDLDAEFDPLELDRYTKLQQLSRGLTENLDGLGEIQNALNDFVHKTESSLQRQDRLNRDLQDEIMQVRLVSFGGIAPQLRQLARRTARELDKDVELEIIGGEVRLDKTILDGVTPALEHMLRNAIDHGIELPDERRAVGKSGAGKIIIECRQVSREIIISVKDDGAGLDLDKIRSKAVAGNLLEEGQDLKPEDMMIYISQSGFSTADQLTEISGRGIGMDVVQTSLRRLSGSIHYDLKNRDSGSEFVINLPISLAVSSAMFIKVSGSEFAVPVRVIEHMVKLDANYLREQLAKSDTTTEIDGKRYKLIDLADYLGLESALEAATGKSSVILVDSGVQNIAVIVDDLLDTQEIVVKNLGEHLARIPIYQGATIRPNGSVALVLDLVGISYYESTVALPDRSRRGVRALPLVMVVDDSLTIRKVAQRDLTALGIDSVLANNGIDAQQQIAKNKPDLILLDIEMPEMDGFEFLAWLRTSSQSKELPVAMISSRSTAKYMNKARELGADAFLSKPYRLDELIDLFNEYLPLEQPLSKEQEV